MLWYRTISKHVTESRSPNDRKNFIIPTLWRINCSTAHLFSIYMFLATATIITNTYLVLTLNFTWTDSRGCTYANWSSSFTVKAKRLFVFFSWLSMKHLTRFWNSSPSGNSSLLPISVYSIMRQRSLSCHNQSDNR